MEEFTSNLPEASNNEGVKVICKVYLTPRDRQATKRAPLHWPENHEVGCSNADGGGGVMSEAMTIPTDYGLNPVYNGGYDGVASNGGEERRQETNVLESKRPRLDQPEHQLLPEAGCSNAVAGVTAADRGMTEATIPTCYLLTFIADDDITISESAYDGGPDYVPTMSTEEEIEVLAPPAISESTTASSKICGEGEMIALISADGERFELPEAAAKLSRTVLDMIEVGSCYPSIPLPNVDGVILAKIVEYCSKHAALISSGAADGPSERSKEERELKTFDAEFIGDAEFTTLFGVLMAANYMNIKRLLDLASRRAADLIKGKSPEQMRRIFGIKNDFTPEDKVGANHSSSLGIDKVGANRVFFFRAR
ncbi:hypothetical protein GUJ93_ZPchr0009g747 [Zizania palustris]|uniref:SKP1 component POZ domain-containing protein n=1 Tax=Zizania palustris TaxID=103762 RepID=A0A8J5RI29_ZIZPA|nr:hypothetical protein GUJ93_ZPchr0009g747 [Zizania palustris]